LPGARTVKVVNRAKSVCLPGRARRVTLAVILVVLGAFVALWFVPGWFARRRQERRSDLEDQP
jgi:hypothetical protein